MTFKEYTLTGSDPILQIKKQNTEIISSNATQNFVKTG
jgi:hypothetical protein